MPAMLKATYKDKDDQLQKEKEKLLEGKLLTKNNKEAVRKFINKWESNQLSGQTILKHIWKIRRMAEIVPNKDFKEFTEDDVQAVMKELNGCKQWTLNTWIQTFRLFWRFLHGLDSTDPVPKAVKWLKKSKPPSSITADDLYTEEEFERILAATNNMMIKTAYAVCKEACLRPGELRNMRLGKCQINGEYSKIQVFGKMGKKKGWETVYVKKYHNLFKSWIDNYPDKANRNDPEAFVWVIPKKKDGKIVYEPVNHYYLEKNLKRICERIGIDKKNILYNFRHTQGTNWYKKYGSVYGKKLMRSKQEETYCHLAEEDIESILLDGKKPEIIEENITEIEQNDEFEQKWTRFLDEKREEMKEMFMKWDQKN